MRPNVDLQENYGYESHKCLNMFLYLFEFKPLNLKQPSK